MGSKKLKLVREEKLYKLLPGAKRKDRLEASGVYAMDDSTCYVIFDSLNKVGKVDLSLKPSKSNEMINIFGFHDGFEDITYDPQDERFYLIVEALEVGKKKYQGVVSEYDSDFTFRRSTMLDPVFKSGNKGFEGVGHLRLDDKEYLVGLWEDRVNKKEKEGRGRLYLFPRADDGSWADARPFDLPKTVRFEDFAAIARREHRVAIVSQSSQKTWLGEINANFDGFAEGGTVYEFPSECYCNVEGVSWISDDQLVMVSDKRKTKGKKKQPKCCADKDQSIHIFRIPAN